MSGLLSVATHAYYLRDVVYLREKYRFEWAQNDQILSQKLEFFSFIISSKKKKKKDYKTSKKLLEIFLVVEIDIYNKKKSIYFLYYTFINSRCINEKSDFATSSRDWTHLFRSAQLRIFYGWRAEIVNMSRTIFVVVIFNLIMQTDSRTIAISENS